MRKPFYFLLLMALTNCVYAQKLPDIQNISLWAPANIKADGKFQEWGAGFAAENKRTELQYTICNDEKNLYLALRATNTEVATKILRGGISFTINTEGKKKNNDAFVITYPIVVRNANGRNAGGRNVQVMGEGMQMSRGTREGAVIGGNTQGGVERTQAQRDSIQLALHKSQLAGVKEIRISGFKSIADSALSIYNEYGLKAAASFDDKGLFFCEFAVPLELLDVKLDSAPEIAYQIKLNGMDIGVALGGQVVFRAVAISGGSGGGGNNTRNNTSRQDMFAATDFWGKYIFQKNK